MGTPVGYSTRIGAYPMAKKTAVHSEPSGHTGHQSELPRLKRIKGQIEGIERMISDGRYCVDILIQVKAAKSALQALENSILQSHLGSCVQQALEAKDSFSAHAKIKE